MTVGRGRQSPHNRGGAESVAAVRPRRAGASTPGRCRRMSRRWGPARSPASSACRHNQQTI